MHTWCSWSALSKGFLALVLLLFAYEFLYGSVQTKNWELNVSYNTIQLPFSTKDAHNATTLPSLASSLGSIVISSANKKAISSANNKGISSANNNSTSPSVLIASLLNGNGVQNRNRTVDTYLKRNNMTYKISSNNDTTSGFINITNVVETVTGHVTTEVPVPQIYPNHNSSTEKPYCPEDPPLLAGRIPVVTNVVPTIAELEREFSWLKPGGHWAPSACRAHKAVALIIPFRCRAEHLLIFLKHIHPFLKRQQLDYTIFIVEQNDGGPFNRAMLMNIGFKEALRHRNFDCFIFHDIDLLPEDDRNLYNCPVQPRHMSVAVNTLKYKLPYSRIFGGVSAITREHFELLNGFSNSFWGWGGEDDDMSNRIAYHKLTISRYPFTIARYTMLTHKKDKANPNRYTMLKTGKTKFNTDGLNSLTYTLEEYKQKLLYTWVLATLHTD